MILSTPAVLILLAAAPHVTAWNCSIPQHELIPLNEVSPVYSKQGIIPTGFQELR